MICQKLFVENIEKSCVTVIVCKYEDFKNCYDENARRFYKKKKVWMKW